MRLATFNVLHGLSLDDGLVEPGRYAAAVGALDADVVGLQEVDQGQPRSGGHDLTALAAGALGAGHHRFAAAVVGTPGESWRPADGEPRVGEPRVGEPRVGEPLYGVALISRFPVRRWLVHRLPPAPVRSPLLVGGRVMLLPDEPRVLLAALVDTPAGPLTVATTHLSFVPGWNVRQLRRAVRALRALPGPRILLGDLNLPAGVARLTTGWWPAVRTPTYPASAPRFQLDHVLTDRPPVVAAAATPPSAVSDHRPLVVDLRYPSAPEGQPHRSRVR